MRIDQTESDNDALEQYSRRNSLRILGIPEDVPIIINLFGTNATLHKVRFSRIRISH